MLQLTSPEQLGLSSARLERAFKLLEGAVRSGAIPGAALLVARRGSVAALRAFGRTRLDADAAPLPPDAIFLTASLTKPVTVTAAMLLVERGALLLDEPACAYLPAFGNRGKEQITLRHLMTHTSGLPDMLPDNFELRGRHAPLAEFVQRICELELDFAPGLGIQYQSSGIAILGALVERVAGLPLPQFLRRELFEPLGMVATSLGLGELPAGRIAEGNLDPQMRGVDWGWHTPYWRAFGAPWGGMFSTVEDLFRFCQLFLNCGRWGDAQLLSPALVQLMTSDQTGALALVPPEVKQGQSWGLGWRLHPASWSFFGNLLSPGSYGHGGATGTVMWVDPPRELVCVLCTTEPSDSSEALLGRCSNLVAAAAL
jgi:CubicO group peptidase (beta-lactamase class C family)